MDLLWGKRARPLSWKTIFYILLFSSFFTILASALQLYQSYQEDIGLIGGRMDLIQRSYLDSLSTSLWEVDKEHVETQLKGILSLSDIQFVDLQERTQELSFNMGVTSTENIISRTFPLEYSVDESEPIFLGDLIVVATLENVYQRTFNKLLLILATQAVKTFCVSFCIFLIIYSLITRHLVTISQYSRSLNLNNLDTPLILNRKPQRHGHQDELDQVVHASNEMRLGFKNEITERENIRAKLLEREEQYRAVVENTGDYIMRYDKKGRHVYANKNALEITGLPEDQYLGKTHREMGFPVHLCELWEENIDSVFNTGTQKSIAFDVEMVEGLMSFDLQLNPEFSDDGNVQTVIGISRDITERKKAEEEKLKLETRLQQSQKMESIGTLAGGIAHDFNNILAAILGYAEMARDDCQPGSSISKDLDEVLEAGIRAKSLVRQILAFSRQDDTERMILQPASIVKETMTMLRPSLPTTIEITQDIDAVTGLVFVDPSQLNQILMNLCTNAFHAMEDTGGKLDISLKEVTLCNEDLVHEPDVTDGTFIQLSIGDSGTGIAPTVKDKIFDPYFTTKETGKGTGMGLSMVHGIVKNYGGFISFYSELGEGTVFHVFLPVVEKEALPENKTNDKIPIGRERILFVDDEEILAKMGKTMLERLGYHVTVRNNSLEALETFQNQPDQFDIVITDQTMPGMTGSDLSRRILQIRPDIPIILCTGFSAIISEEKAKSMGIKEFALKPLAKKDIAKLIRKALDVS